MKSLENKNKLHSHMLNGSRILSENVGATLGPRGRFVILCEKDGSPYATKDGVTVAKFVSSNNVFENAAIQIVRQASMQTNEDAGDGTTTSCILAHAIFEESERLIASGFPAIQISRGIEKASEHLVKLIKEKSRKIQSLDDIRSIACISANNDLQIGNIISDAFATAGKDGVITVEESKGSETVMDAAEGFNFPGGVVTEVFCNNEVGEKSVQYQNALVYVTDETINTHNQLLKILNIAIRARRPLIIAAFEINEDPLAMLIANSMQGKAEVCAIRTSEYGEARRANLKDLAVSVGASFMSAREGRDPDGELNINDFGTVESAYITRHSALLINGGGDELAIEERINEIKSDIKMAESLQEAGRLQERVSRLASAAVIIRVGSHSEIEMIEKRHRIQDALCAVRSAQEEGCLPGGGVSLLRLSLDLIPLEQNEKDSGVAAGIRALRLACAAPIRKIAENAGIGGEVACHRVLSSEDFNVGLNAATNEIVDLFECGVVDPAKVVRCAVQNGASVARTLIVADYAIIEHG